MPRSRRIATLAAVGWFAVGGCSGSRDDRVGGLPGGSAAPATTAFEPAPVPAAAEPLVDGLIANLTDGVSLVARVDAADAPCVARRWIGILDPDALLAAGVTAERMTTVRLDELPELTPTPLDEPRARALVDAFAACDVDYENAVLASMQTVGTIDASQQTCIADALPEGLLMSVTLSVLLEPAVDPALNEQYRAAVEPCVG